VLTVETTDREVILRRASTRGEFEAFVEGLRSDPAGAWEDHAVVALLVETTHTVVKRYEGAPWSLLANDDPSRTTDALPVCWPLPAAPLDALTEAGELRLRPTVDAA
jgi:hypothetical protein